MKAMVRFLRSQNGWNLCVALLYFGIVAGGYCWAQSPADVWERFLRTWLVAWESIAGCPLMFFLYLCNPWFGKSNARGDSLPPRKENNV